MKISFGYFQIQKWILQTVRSEKVDEKNGVICLVSMFFSCVLVLKMSKKVIFLQFCADFSKKFRSIKAIYIYVSGSSRYSFSENGIVYYAMTYYFGDISIWINTLREAIVFVKFPLFFWRTKHVNQKWKRGFPMMGILHSFSHNKTKSLRMFPEKVNQSKKILRKAKSTAI